MIADRLAAEQIFIARGSKSRELLVQRHTENGCHDGRPCASYFARSRHGEGVSAAYRFHIASIAEREGAELFERSFGDRRERAIVTTLFDATREEHTYVFAHGRVGQYRFGLPTGECHLQAIHLIEGKHVAHKRAALGTIIVPDAVAAMWAGVQHAGRFKHVEVYSDPDLGDASMIVRDHRPALLGFPFLLRDVVSAVEPA